MKPRFDESEMKDSWLFGPEFILQLALFEETGYGDWEIVDSESGPRDNRTDGETHNIYRVRRITGSSGRGSEWTNRHSPTVTIDVNANVYSWKYTLKKTREAVSAAFEGAAQ